MPKQDRRRIVAATLMAAGLAALMASAASTPAAAAERDVKGWFVALDLALTQPNGLDQHIASRIDGTGGSPVSERILLKNDSDATFRGSVGYEFGEEYGGLQVSYWSFDNDDRESFTRTGIINPAIFGYGYFGYMSLCNTSTGSCDPSLPMTFRGRSGVKAKTTDLDYTRDVPVGDRFHLKWLAGLRVASYEEDQGFEGSDGTYNYRQSKHIKADAVGLKVGAAGLFTLTDHLSLRSGFSWSFLQAKTDGKSSQTFVDNPAFCAAPPCIETDKGSDDRLRGDIQDLDLSAVWSSGPVDVSLGYTVSFWNGLVKDPVPANGFLLTGESSSRDSIGFNSLHVGVAWRFGGGRRLTSGP